MEKKIYVITEYDSNGGKPYGVVDETKIEEARRICDIMGNRYYIECNLNELPDIPAYTITGSFMFDETGKLVHHVRCHDTVIKRSSFKEPDGVEGLSVSTADINRVPELSEKMKAFVKNYTETRPKDEIDLIAKLFGELNIFTENVCGKAFFTNKPVPEKSEIGDENK